MTSRSHAAKSIETARGALREVDRAISAQELHRFCRRRGDHTGLASVYRALDRLVVVGEAERIRRGGEDAYVLCPPAHHHHAICRACGRADVMRDCAQQPARTESGFAIDDHETVYYGHCAECQRGPGQC